MLFKLQECVSSQTAAAIDKITGLIKDTFGNQPNIAPVFVCQKLVINNRKNETFPLTNHSRLN